MRKTQQFITEEKPEGGDRSVLEMQLINQDLGKAEAFLRGLRLPSLV